VPPKVRAPKAWSLCDQSDSGPDHQVAPTRLEILLPLSKFI
jgi:hypothetical protein